MLLEKRHDAVKRPADCRIGCIAVESMAESGQGNQFVFDAVTLRYLVRAVGRRLPKEAICQATKVKRSGLCHWASLR